MNEVIYKSLGFLFIIFLGNMFKNKGYLKDSDNLLLSKIVMTFTLPATILIGVTKVDFSLTSLIIVLLGIFPSILLGLTAKKIFKRKPPVERATAMVHASCYSIGNVTIPYASSLFPGLGMQYISMFDIGNAITLFGIMFTMATNEISEEHQKFNLYRLIKILSKSIPFVTYIFILIINLANMELPSIALALAKPLADANAFIIMFMIGASLKLNMSPYVLKASMSILSIRFIGFVVFSLIVYFIIPIPLFAKQIVILCLASPIPTTSVVFSYGFNDQSSIPAFVTSLSILIGIIMSTLVVMFVF